MKAKLSCPLIFSLEFAFSYPSDNQGIPYGKIFHVMAPCQIFMCPRSVSSLLTERAATSKTPKEKPIGVC